MRSRTLFSDDAGAVEILGDLDLLSLDLESLSCALDLLLRALSGAFSEEMEEPPSWTIEMAGILRGGAGLEREDSWAVGDMGDMGDGMGPGAVRAPLAFDGDRLRWPGSGELPGGRVTDLASW